MDAALRAFLEGRSPDFDEPVVWGGGQHRLTMSGYLTSDRPPDAFVLAGRAIVVEGSDVLVIRSPDGEHVVPGGRREVGESPEDAARREVLEETGWEVDELTAFAAVHMHYHTPRPTGVGRVIYPDFIWQIFRAGPTNHRPESRQTGEWEEAAYFRPIEQMLDVVQPYQRVLLRTALALS